MKRSMISVFALLLAALCLLVSIPASATGETAGDSADSNNYKAADYTIPFELFTDAQGGKSVSIAPETMKDGRDVIAIRKGSDANLHCQVAIGDDHATKEEEMMVRLGDYKYLVVKVQYDVWVANFGTNHRIPIQIAQMNNRKDENGEIKVYTTNPWTTIEADYIDKNGEYKVYGEKQSAVWYYLIYDLSKDNTKSAYYNDVSQYPVGLDGDLVKFQFYPWCNGGFNNSNLYDDDVCYLQFATFTNDYENLITLDKAADEVIKENNANNNSGDNGDNGNTTEAPDKVPTPETAAPVENETKAPDTDEGGCASSAAVGMVALLTVSGAALLTAKRKKKD